MCLVKIRGEVEDDVIVPARVVERESVRSHQQQRETQIVSTAPAVIERPSRSRRYSSSNSSNISSTNSITSSRSSTGYADARYERHIRRNNYQHHAATSSYDGRSYDGRSHDGRSTAGRSSSRSRERGYYREHGRVVSGGSYERSERRGSYRYVDPQPRGSSHEVRAEIQRAEEHLQRAAELQEREKRMRETRAITYDPRSSSVSHRSYEHSKDGRRRSDIIVVQETERHRDRHTSR